MPRPKPALPATPAMTEMPVTLATNSPARGQRPACRGGEPQGFTLVELMVTLAVIAALMGILMVGLQSARRTSLKTKQLSDLSQVYKAFAQYAANNNDAALPGYLADDVQSVWRVNYKSKDGSKIPAQYARTYPWRLLPYLDNSFVTLFGYLEVEDDDFFKPKNPDGSVNTAGLQVVSDQPAFGYNAYYLGGWWKSEAGVPTLTYGNATWTDAGGTQVTGRVVATRVGNVNAPSTMVAFTAATFREPGFYKEGSEFVTGSAWVVPHILADTTIWEPSDGGSYGNVQASAFSIFGSSLPSLLANILPVQSAATGLQVNVAQSVPLRRFGGQVAVVHVDGNTTTAGLGELLDQRRWMNPAQNSSSPNTFTHSNTD